MKIVLDTNIFMSALIKDSGTRRILLASGHTFLLPEIAIEELEKHREETIKKTNQTHEEYHRTLTKLLEYVETIPTEDIRLHLKEAEDIIGKTDKDDIAFIATALAHKGSVIWTADRHFEKQDRIRIIKTKDLLEEQ